MKGYYENMPANEYHADRSLGSSSFKELLRAPAWFRYYRDNPDKRPVNPAMNLGTAIHLLTLEPERAAEELIVWPKRRAGKEWAYFCEINADKTIITADEYEIASGCAEAVRTHPVAARYFFDHPGVAEASYFTEINGVRVKCRPDWRPSDVPAVVDLKTTTDARLNSFSRVLFNMKYHLQAALYLDIVSLVENQGQLIDWFWVVVEIKPPHLVQVYRALPGCLHSGRSNYESLLAVYKHCKEESHWPGYDPTVLEIGLPKWAEKQEEDAYYE